MLEFSLSDTPECSSPFSKDCLSGFMEGVSTKLKVPVKCLQELLMKIDQRSMHHTKNLCNMNIQYITKETPSSYSYS